MRRRLKNLRRALECFRTTRKIIVFESDDWGLDGMPSSETYDALAHEGIIDPNDRFNKCGRETAEDLNLLYETLAGLHDGDGRSPALTANFVMANPDFESIEGSDFRQYSWIAIDESARKPQQAALLAKYREGLERGLFRPQYHGRDHISAETWLRALRDRDPVAHAGFRHRVPMARQSRFLESEYTESNGQRLRPLHPEAIRERASTGVAIFRRTFGLRPLTSIAPFYLWSDDVELALGAEGVRCMQAGGHRLLPGAGDSPPIHRQSLFGERGAAGMVYMVRNCWFEPSRDGEEAADRCLSEMAFAFSRGWPAVIDTHRVNYVGVVDPASRDRNMRGLRDLIRQMLQLYPTARFTTSDQLVDSLLDNDRRAAGDTEAEPLMPAASFASRVCYTARERFHWWRQR